MQTNNKKSSNPPNLLRGIVVLVLTTIVSILALTWLIINSQVEQLVTQRTSEYAHSIAGIAADSSAEALLADDVLQLNLLVENVAKDPYIKQATIYSEDGIIVSQFPNETPSLAKPQVMLETQQQVAGEIARKTLSNEDNKIASVERSQQFILRQKNVPFIEPIVYQDITAGWFKIEIDSHLLGQKFRDAYLEIQVFTAGVALALFLIMLALLSRFELSIKKVVNSCHHLLIQNKIRPTGGKKEWIKALSELSEQHPQQLKEHTILPASQIQWQQHAKVSNALVCLFEFEINYQENADIAENLTLAEHYLNKSIQAYGVQSQGDILTGCVVPFYSNTQDSNQLITSALCFIELVRSLLARFKDQIQMKACLAITSILVLEDDNDIISGVALLDGNSQKLKKSLQAINFGETISLFIQQQQLNNLVENQLLDLSLTNEELGSQLLCHKLGELNPELLQQINRKREFIRQDF